MCVAQTRGGEKGSECITLYIRHRSSRVSYTYAFSFIIFLFFPFNNFGSLVTRRSEPLRLEEKNRSYVKQEVAGGRRERRKRKKLVSKGKLISGHFVSTRSQPSSASPLPLFRIEYSRFFVHHPSSRESLTPLTQLSS